MLRHIDLICTAACSAAPRALFFAETGGFSRSLCREPPPVYPPLPSWVAHPRVHAAAGVTTRREDEGGIQGRAAHRFGSPTTAPPRPKESPAGRRAARFLTQEARPPPCTPRAPSTRASPSRGPRSSSRSRWSCRRRSSPPPPSAPPTPPRAPRPSRRWRPSPPPTAAPCASPRACRARCSTARSPALRNRRGAA